MKRFILFLAFIFPFLSFAEEWPSVSVATSSQLWSQNNLIDSSPTTIWSSNIHTVSSEPEWLAFWFRDGFKSVNYIKLTPRFLNGRALGLPQSIRIYYSSGGRWNYIEDVTLSAPNDGNPVLIVLPGTYKTDGLHIVATTLGQDDRGSYVFQLGNVVAGYHPSQFVQDTSPYPVQNAFKIKGLRPDFVLPQYEVIGNNAGSVGMNIVWAQWEPNYQPAPCSVGQIEFDNHCFTPPSGVIDQIRTFSNQNVNVTAVLYGVPAWARGRLPCKATVSPIFCIPDNPANYARFVGMIADYFDGTKGNGRIVNFVIHNEVNTNDWFDIGCTLDAATCQNLRVDIYSKHFNAAYDQIISQQKNAKVFASLDHHFFGSRGSVDPTGTSGQRILEGVNHNAAGRQWRVAFHPYSVDLFQPKFSPDDRTSLKVTFGNLGQLEGWLMKSFPNQPYAWDVHLTEVGFNTTTESDQSKYLCRSFWNVLGTPGISSYLYHRELDFGALEGGLNLGLIRSDHSYKPSWATWALANRNDVSPPILSCGFENLPYIALVRSFNPTRGHWASTRVPPDGFVKEAAWKVLREQGPNTRPIYECAYLNHNFLSPDVNCEQQAVNLGPVGYLYTSPPAGSIALYRCAVNSGQDHFVSTDGRCESQQFEQFLGYVFPCGANECRLPN